MFPAIIFNGSTDPSGLEDLHDRGFTITPPHVTLRHTTNSRTTLINPSQRTLCDKKQLSEETDTFVPGGILTHNLSKRAAKDPLLSPRILRDWLLMKYKGRQKTVIFKIQTQHICYTILIFPEHVTNTCMTCISES